MQNHKLAIFLVIISQIPKFIQKSDKGDEIEVLWLGHGQLDAYILRGGYIKKNFFAMV